MKNLFKYLSIFAIAGAVGIQTTYAANTCAADEEEHINYYMFLNVDTKKYFEDHFAALATGQNLAFYNGADKYNNVQRGTIISDNNVEIVTTGTSSITDTGITWTLEDFWKKYYNAKVGENKETYIYDVNDKKEHYIMHDKWWKYDNDTFTNGKEYSPVSSTLKNSLLKRIQDDMPNLKESDLLTKGTLIPRTSVTVPSNLTTSTNNFLRWQISRVYDNGTYVPEGINLDNETVIYSPAAYYVKYCVKKTGTTTPEDQNKKFTVKYDANGGTGAPASQEGTPSSCVAISSQKPTKEGLNFLGWSANSNASTPDKQYEAGKSYCGPNDITLYAVYSTTNKPTGISSHLIVFSVIALGAVGALVVAKKKNLFKQI